MSERLKERKKNKEQKITGQRRQNQNNSVCTNIQETGMQQSEFQPSSRFLIARDESDRQRQMEVLCEVLGPVFFGEKRAETEQELEQYFIQNYSIDVKHDFYEGDEHYDEYIEAQQAIAEGMSIYGGSIAFEDSALAKLADRIWQDMEDREDGGFRRINTALEE